MTSGHGLQASARLSTSVGSSGSEENINSPSLLNMRIRSTPCLAAIVRITEYAASRRSAAIICHVAAVMLPRELVGAEGHAVQELRLLSPDVDEQRDGLHDQDEEGEDHDELGRQTPRAPSTSSRMPGHLGPPFSGVSPATNYCRSRPCSCRVETVMGRGWVETGAGVEWFSGHRALERPVRLRLGGRVLELAVENAWVEGPPSGGRELIRVFIVRDPGAGVFVFRPMTAGGSGWGSRSPSRSGCVWYHCRAMENLVLRLPEIRHPAAGVCACDLGARIGARMGRRASRRPDGALARANHAQPVEAHRPDWNGPLSSDACGSWRTYHRMGKAGPVRAP